MHTPKLHPIYIFLLIMRTPKLQTYFVFSSPFEFLICSKWFKNSLTMIRFLWFGIREAINESCDIEFDDCNSALVYYFMEVLSADIFANILYTFWDYNCFLVWQNERFPGLNSKKIVCSWNSPYWLRFLFKSSSWIARIHRDLSVAEVHESDLR